VTISTPKNIVCIGQTVNFTADVQHAGSTPSYQWTVNGSNAGTNRNSFSTNALSDGDVVTCDVTVDPLFTCATTTTVNSTPISMTVKNQGDPGLSLAVTGNDVCPGVPVLFAATVTDGGTGYTLQWKVNGKTYNENTAAFSRSNLNNGDLVSCIITPGSDACLTDVVTSNVITAVIRTEPVVRVDPSDTIVLYGSTMKLRGLISGGYSSFVWSDAGKVVDPSSLTPVTTPVTEDRVYTLAVTNSDGCTASGSATVVVTRLLAMPSGFTPNADGKNDVFRIPPGIHVKLEGFAVYDRYGERVFFTQDPTMGWDGTFGGHPAPAGTYVYYVQGVDVKGPVYGKGTVVLVR
jgi:gliding motility-associated-like protein